MNAKEYLKKEWPEIAASTMAEVSAHIAKGFHQMKLSEITEEDIVEELYYDDDDYDKKYAAAERIMILFKGLEQ